MIRVTLTKVLEEWWGADEAMALGGAPMLRELLDEALGALLEDMEWRIEVEPAPTP